MEGNVLKSVANYCTLFESENERQKIEPISIPLPRAFKNFPDVKTRNDFFFHNWTSISRDKINEIIVPAVAFKKISTTFSGDRLIMQCCNTKTTGNNNKGIYNTGKFKKGVINLDK